MHARSIVFRIERCVDPTFKSGYCKPKNEIDKVLEGLQVQFWIIDSSIDFNLPAGQMTKKIQTLIS